jgi:hypothetical protein
MSNEKIAILIPSKYGLDRDFPTTKLFNKHNDEFLANLKYDHEVISLPPDLTIPVDLNRENHVDKALGRNDVYR